MSCEARTPNGLVITMPRPSSMASVSSDAKQFGVAAYGCVSVLLSGPIPAKQAASLTTYVLEQKHPP